MSSQAPPPRGLYTAGDATGATEARSDAEKRVFSFNRTGTRTSEHQQNDAAASWSLSGRHQLLRSGALPLPPRDAHPGRLHQLHPPGEGGAADVHPRQAAVQRAERGRELGRRQLQLGPGRGQARADIRGAREEEEEERKEQNRRCEMSQQEERENRVSAEGVGEAGGRERGAEGSDRGAEAAEAAAGLHAEPAPAHLHRPRPERPDARRREEPVHPAHQREHPAARQPLLLLLLLLAPRSSAHPGRPPLSGSSMIAGGKDFTGTHGSRSCWLDWDFHRYTF